MRRWAQVLRTKHPHQGKGGPGDPSKERWGRHGVKVKIGKWQRSKQGHGQYYRGSAT